MTTRLFHHKMKEGMSVEQDPAFLLGLEGRCVFEDTACSKLGIYLVRTGCYCNSHTAKLIALEKELSITKSM